jgi:hypothetical protein
MIQNRALQFHFIKTWFRFLGVLAKLRKATVSFVMSVCLSAWNNSAPTEGIFMTCDIREFFEILSIKIRFVYNLTGISGTLHEDRYTFVIISRSILLRRRNISIRSFREKSNTYFIFNFLFRKSWCLWDNVENYIRGGRTTHVNIIRRLPIK